MKKFHFPLETLLKVKTQRLKILKKDLSMKVQAVETLEEALKTLKIEISEIEEKKVLKRVDFLHKERALSEMKKTQNKILHAEEALLREKKKVTTSFKERKMIAKMKKKRYACWNEKQHMFEGEI